MNPRLRDLTVAILLAATTAGGCRVTEDTAPCPATDGDCSACRCPGSDSCGAPGDDSTPGEDTEEPRGDCSGAFFISDLDGNPAEEPKGNESWLFDPSQLRAFRVLVKPADWAWLQENALEEQYVPAVVELDGLRYHGAAIRFKGAYTTLQGCFDAEGNQVCPKLSMKLRFNEYDPCGRLRGVRRLVFNAAVYDFSMLRERVAYQVVRDMGLAGPRAVHATLQINDEPPSLYVLVEAPDKEFVQERWAK
ncbi:MAG: CotH kinase family protein, partial [Deltaproteobacteria bacterium]|nr:CotH kinase family protein [Deltaproteobacteria bacterium]